MPLERQKKFEDSWLWKQKVRFQFSGWLQYIIHGIWVVALLLIAGIGWLIGYWPVILFWAPFGFAIFLSIALVGTIVIVKYGLHPTERVPPDKAKLDAFDLMLSRHSCRSFQARNLTAEHHVELMDTVRLYSQEDHQLGQEPVRFEYIAAPLKVWPVVGAHEFLVAIAPSEYNRLSVIDVGRSLQKVVLHATRMGLATCWIGPGADQSSIIQHLGDKFNPAKDHVICVCAIGYESMYKPLFIRLMQKLQRRRLPHSELFFLGNPLTTPLDVESEPFSDYARCYEACRWSPSSYNSQTTRCAAVMAPANGQSKLTRFDFYCATSSRYYAPLALGIWCANWETGCDALKKPGQFAVLSSEKRTSDVASEPPRYDVSWILD